MSNTQLIITGAYVGKNEFGNLNIKIDATKDIKSFNQLKKLKSIIDARFEDAYNPVWIDESGHKYARITIDKNMYDGTQLKCNLDNVYEFTLNILVKNSSKNKKYLLVRAARHPKKKTESENIELLNFNLNE